MSDQLSPVPNIDLHRLASNQVVRSSQAVRSTPVYSPLPTETAPTDDAQEVEKPKASEPVSRGPFRDTTIRFEVDAETHDVTLLIMDRETREVIRSIPPEEMRLMDPGELLELFT